MSYTLLFQGDSITDCGRNRDVSTHLGGGYALMAGSTLLCKQAENPPTVYNRGISGHRTCDLLARWQTDCLDLKPDVLSLYIGVNNTWRRYDSDDPTPADVFEAELLDLLDQTFNKTECDPARSILLEPFVLDVPAGTKAHWLPEDLAAKQDAVLRAAKKFGTLHLPLQSIFDEACDRAPAAFWAGDGVHPSHAGHRLIASAWLDIMRPVLPD